MLLTENLRVFSRFEALENFSNGFCNCDLLFPSKWMGLKRVRTRLATVKIQNNQKIGGNKMCIKSFTALSEPFTRQRMYSKCTIFKLTYTNQWERFSKRHFHCPQKISWWVFFVFFVLTFLMKGKELLIHTGSRSNYTLIQFKLIQFSWLSLRGNDVQFYQYKWSSLLVMCWYLISEFVYVFVVVSCFLIDHLISDFPLTTNKWPESRRTCSEGYTTIEYPQILAAKLKFWLEYQNSQRFAIFCLMSWCLIHKAHLHFWRKLVGIFSYEIPTIL
jgi:hypothetical protein